MKRIVLISCVKKKLDRLARAEDLYVSELFRKSLAYARTLKADKIFILSAKYYLLPLRKKVKPYNVTLNAMSAADRRCWADKVVDALAGEANLEKDEFFFLAGARYRSFLVPRIRKCHIPMKGMKIGEQLQFLKARLQ